MRRIAIVAPPAATAITTNLSDACYTESCLPIRGICREKSEHHPQSLNHRKSDSYAAPTPERRFARAGISDPKGGGPSPGCRPEVFPVWAPRRDRNPDRLPTRSSRQRTLRIDLEHDRA